MKIEVFPSASGDCDLITSNDDKRLLAPPVSRTPSTMSLPRRWLSSGVQQEAIDVAYISHIDRDHIGGVLRMLDHEVRWRVFEHMRSKKRKFKQPKAPRLPEVRQIWHNAFLEDIAKTEAVRLRGG